MPGGQSKVLPLVAVFVDKGTFDRQMLAVNEARNALAHHRDMNEGEQHAAIGGLYWFEACLRRARQAEQEAGGEEPDAALVRVGAKGGDE
jgi:hypothetical protein